MKGSKRIHFISLGESSMADLAIGLKKSGNIITGSDEVLADDITSKLLRSNLLPEEKGWSPEKIGKSLDAVIVGSKTSISNPELKRAQEFQIPVYSIPDFICERSIDKQCLVVAGSSGKNIIALLIIHALTYHKRKFDYVVSTPPAGKESLISLSDVPLIIIEGQEVRSSPLDPTLGFLKYQKHIGVISDIQWTPSENGLSKDDYIKQFSRFETSLPKSGILLYNEKDPAITSLLTLHHPDVLYVPYAAHPSILENGLEYLVTDKEHLPLKITGVNALLNMSAAKETLKKIGVTSSMFYQAIRSFQMPGR